ncbi:MmgE/PrpD family protein [soil metagenome]
MTMHASLTQRLAALIQGITDEVVTPLAIAQARMCIVDAVGVALAGSAEQPSQILLKTPGVATAPGRSLVFGTQLRTSALDATLLNGTSAHALDFDDFSSIMGGHHTVPVMPALFALAEEHGLSGKQVLHAYIAGVEVEIRMARALGFHHYDKGWHPTATIGTFGAAAAAAHLLRLDVEQTATALGIAASMAAGLKSNFGTMVKPFHAGQCGRNGLLAVLMTQQGFESSEQALEHHQGFLNVFNGAGNFDVDKLFAHWADPLEIEHETIALKQFPCCGSTHPAITVMLQLVREEGIGAADVAAIEVMPHRRRLRHTDNAVPNTPLEAKFSVQYAVVRALLDGSVRMRDFEGSAFKTPAVRELLRITQARPNPDMSDEAEEQWGAEVIVTTRDGRRLSRRVEQLVGRGGASPMSDAEMWDKFEDCATLVMPTAQARAAYEQLNRLESLRDFRQLAPLLQGETRQVEHA